MANFIWFIDDKNVEVLTF